MNAAFQVEGVAFAATRPKVNGFAVRRKLREVRIQAERDGGLSEQDALALIDAIDEALLTLACRDEEQHQALESAKDALKGAA